MKFLLPMFFLYIHYSQCQSSSVDEFKKIRKTFPKKVWSGMVQFHNAGKYVKPSINYPKNTKSSNGEEIDGFQRNYTAFAKPFPKAGQELQFHQIVPDSPYFPIETPPPSEKASRVKKELTPYVPRLKRSVDANDETLSSNTRSKKPKTKAPKSATHKKSSVTKHSKTPHYHDKKDKRELSQYSKPTRPHSKAAKQKLSNTRGRVKKSKSDDTKTVPKKLKISRNHSQKHQPRAQRARSVKSKSLRTRKGPNARRLIAGRDALIEDYPYVVSIQKDRQHWCSGSILHQRMIITTANCMWRSKTISRMRVRAGSRHTDRGGQVVKIQEVMKHPNWKVRRDPDNDVALVLVDQNIRFSHSVHGVDLPNRVMMPAFDDAWITSWGTERRDGIFDPNNAMSLQVYHARLLERDKCNNVTQRFGVTVTENFICLAQSGRRAPCTRDTGAPAVSDGVLWGMASWGIRKLCGTERFPAMFSYIGSQSNMDFIINATHYLMSDERQSPFADRYPVPRYPLTTPTPLTLPY